MKRQDNEHHEQSTLIQWCRLTEHKHPELKLLFAIPNGGPRHIGVAHKLKREGVKSGVPDLFLPVAREEFHGLFIEMKVVGGRPSQNQAVWLANLTQQGYMTIVCFNWIVAKEAILKYLSMSPPHVTPPLVLPARQEGGGEAKRSLRGAVPFGPQVHRKSAPVCPTHRFPAPADTPFPPSDCSVAASAGHSPLLNGATQKQRLTGLFLILSLFLSSPSFAKGKLAEGDAEILDYIASHNSLVMTLEKSNKKTWSQYLKDNLSVKLKGSYTMSPTGDQFTVGGEGGAGGVSGTSTATGSETTSGISFAFPLYPFQDPRERKEGVENISKAREEVIGKAITLITGLRSAQAKLKSVTAIQKAHKGNVDYLKLRVDAGVDYQKNFFNDYLAALKAENELDDLTSQVATNTSALLALVEPKNRAELKALLEGREPGEDEDKKKDEGSAPKQEENKKDLTIP